jgi:hypothetical protein
MLVESIITGWDEHGKLRVEITYRFGEPPPERGRYVDTVDKTQGWADPIPRPDAEGRRKFGLSPVVVHAKRLTNLASPNNELHGRSAGALARELVAAGALGVELVVHAGSHGGEGEEGTDRLVDGLDRARELAAGFAGLPGFRRSSRRPTAARRRTPKRCGWSRSSPAGCAKRRTEYRI